MCSYLNQILHITNLRAKKLFWGGGEFCGKVLANSKYQRNKSLMEIGNVCLMCFGTSILQHRQLQKRISWEKLRTEISTYSIHFCIYFRLINLRNSLAWGCSPISPLSQNTGNAGGLVPICKALPPSGKHFPKLNNGISECVQSTNSWPPTVKSNHYTRSSVDTQKITHLRKVKNRNSETWSSAADADPGHWVKGPRCPSSLQARDPGTVRSTNSSDVRPLLKLKANHLTTTSGK